MVRWVRCPDCGLLFQEKEYYRDGEKRILDILINGSHTFSEIKNISHLSATSLSENLKRLVSKGKIKHDYLSKRYLLD